MVTFASTTSSKTPKSPTSTPTSKTNSPTLTLQSTPFDGALPPKKQSQQELLYWLPTPTDISSSSQPKLANRSGTVSSPITKSLPLTTHMIAGTLQLEEKITSFASTTNKLKKHLTTSKDSSGTSQGIAIESSQSNSDPTTLLFWQAEGGTKTYYLSYLGSYLGSKSRRSDLHNCGAKNNRRWHRSQRRPHFDSPGKSNRTATTLGLPHKIPYSHF